ncbi:hypothetical protein FJZ40_02185 [Candidatus Shapirobacteria bacterium]|nr:hypothetical protein [Candidatus Shapirobacteria bacterium]
MEFIDRILTPQEIVSLKRQYGNYFKLTVDSENEWVVAGSELHADAEKLLLEKGSRQDDIWGGGINLSDKQIDTSAVLNLRPRLDNDNLEILDQARREKFISIVKKYFQQLWR